MLTRDSSEKSFRSLESCFHLKWRGIRRRADHVAMVSSLLTILTVQTALERWWMGNTCKAKESMSTMPTKRTTKRRNMAVCLSECSPSARHREMLKTQLSLPRCSRVSYISAKKTKRQSQMQISRPPSITINRIATKVITSRSNNPTRWMVTDKTEASIRMAWWINKIISIIRIIRPPCLAYLWTIEILSLKDSSKIANNITMATPKTGSNIMLNSNTQMLIMAIRTTVKQATLCNSNSISISKWLANMLASMVAKGIISNRRTMEEVMGDKATMLRQVGIISNKLVIITMLWCRIRQVDNECHLLLPLKCHLLRTYSRNSSSSLRVMFDWF